jgi:hypothetical protein
MPHVDGRTVAVAVTFAAPDVAVILLAALRLALAELVTSPPP